MAKTAPVTTMPGDIRLMNATALLLAAIGALALAGIALM